jgi:hypothetical protein
MNTEALFLFLILLLGLLLCSFLGGNCDKEGFDIKYKNDPNGATLTVDGRDIKYRSNPKGGTLTVDGSNNISETLSNIYNSFATSYDNYNHYSGSGSSSQLQNGMVFTDSKGNTITVITNSNGTQSLQAITVGQSTPMVLSSTPPSSYKGTVTANTFYAPVGGMTATVITDNNNQTAIKVTIQGNTVIFKQSGSSANSSSSLTSTQYYGSTGYPIQSSSNSLAYQGPYGGSANYAQGYYGGSAGSVTGPQGNTAYYAQGPQGGSASSTTGSYGGSAGSVTGPQGNTAAYAQGPQGNTVAGASSDGYGDQYYSTMPQGIPKSQIPSGQEDLYILKSQVVPPVCPACPTVKGGQGGEGGQGGQSKCPPCPACARCPEPSFECKKVPNYSAIGSDSLPAPVLSDFSSFGM